MRVLARDWTQLVNRASDHLSRSLYLSTPYPPHYVSCAARHHKYHGRQHVLNKIDSAAS